jgi:hypothetical protein
MTEDRARRRTGRPGAAEQGDSRTSTPPDDSGPSEGDKPTPRQKADARSADLYNPDCRIDSSGPGCMPISARSAISAGAR